MANGLPLFFGDEEETLFNSMGRELVETLVNQHFDLFSVNINETEDNFYGEAKQKVYDPMVEVKSRIQIQDVDVISEGGVRRISKGDMIAGIYRQHLTELDVTVDVGDFLGYQGKYYEVYDAGYNLDGLDKKWAADRDFMWMILARVVTRDIFKSTEGDS